MPPKKKPTVSPFKNKKIKIYYIFFHQYSVNLIHSMPPKAPNPKKVADAKGREKPSRLDFRQSSP